MSKYLLNNYFYTINHNRLGLNYFYFSLVTALSGAVLATAIRLEMAYPGSSFFNGDSLKYLQVITAHAIIMIFFVVVPIFFGGFANFLLPYHVGSKDVAFPSLNSLGFWIQPCGYLLIAKIGFVRTEYWSSNDQIVDYLNVTNESHFSSLYVNYLAEVSPEFSIYKQSIEHAYDEEDPEGLYRNPYVETTYNLSELALYQPNEPNADFNVRKPTIMESALLLDSESGGLWFASVWGYECNPVILKFLNSLNSTVQTTNSVNYSLHFWNEISAIPETFFSTLVRWSSKFGSSKRHVVRCANHSMTVSGWTFITPFSSKVQFTGVGVQDMLILGIYFAGISTTISLVNLLATRSCLSMSGLSNSRVLLPFISIAILLMFSALAVITPVLGSAMLMLMLDRHWQTSFFDFAYGGDPVFFHHLFWFFGHPEVYVLIIPAFGVINSVLPVTNYRRVASNHHLIWAVYIMNYMGFLVWGHHMYLIGLDHSSSSLYSTITIMISMPATINVVNWTYSLVNGALKNDVVLLSSISFILFFLVAGFTGMWLSHVSLNVSMHDTLYVVAHFHLMLSGAVVMGIFVGFYFYFNTFLNVKYSNTFAYLHIIYYTGGQWVTFLPLFWVSFSGLPSSLHDYPAAYMGWQSMSTAGHFLTMLGVLAFYATLFEAHIENNLGIYLSSIVASFSKSFLYYSYNIIYYQAANNAVNFVPSWYLSQNLYSVS